MNLFRSTIDKFSGAPPAEQIVRRSSSAGEISRRSTWQAGNSIIESRDVSTPTRDDKLRMRRMGLMDDPRSGSKDTAPSTRPGSKETPSTRHSTKESTARTSVRAYPTKEEVEKAEEVRNQAVMTKLTAKACVKQAMDALMKHLANSKLTHEDLFKIIDANGDGELSRQEMQIGLRKIGVALEPKDLDAVLRGFDSDGNGTIDFEEFTNLLTTYAATYEIEADVPYAKPGRLYGFDVGDTVRPTVTVMGVHSNHDAVGSVVSAKAAGQNKKKIECIVKGKGFKDDTLMVQNRETGEYLSLKPNQLALVHDAEFDKWKGGGPPSSPVDESAGVQRKSVRGGLNRRSSV